MFVDSELMAEMTEMFHNGEIDIAEYMDYVDNFDGDIVDFL